MKLFFYKICVVDDAGINFRCLRSRLIDRRLNFYLVNLQNSFTMTILTGAPLSWAITATAGSGFLL
jgi:hypothetical protein